MYKRQDITLDAALLALNLYQSGFKTFNIAVGNNLMEEKWASDLFRLNKSFIIQRSGATKKEIYSQNFFFFRHICLNFD